jgi:hypothetical protein
MISAVHDAEAGVNRGRMLELAHSFLSGDDHLPESEAESDAALEALRDTQVGVEFHQMEAALRRGVPQHNE